MHPYVHNSTLYNSQDVETTCMRTERWMDKEDVVRVCDGILLSPQKEWNDASCSNMDRPGDYQSSEVSQTEKDKQK